MTDPVATMARLPLKMRLLPSSTQNAAFDLSYSNVLECLGKETQCTIQSNVAQLHVRACVAKAGPVMMVLSVGHSLKVLIPLHLKPNWSRLMTNLRRGNKCHVLLLQEEMYTTEIDQGQSLQQP